MNSRHRRRGRRQWGGHTDENLESTVRNNRLNQAHLLSTCMHEREQEIKVVRKEGGIEGRKEGKKEGRKKGRGGRKEGRYEGRKEGRKEGR